MWKRDEAVKAELHRPAPGQPRRSTATAPPAAEAAPAPTGHAGDPQRGQERML